MRLFIFLLEIHIVVYNDKNDFFRGKIFRVQWISCRIILWLVKKLSQSPPPPLSKGHEQNIIKSLECIYNIAYHSI